MLTPKVGRIGLVRGCRRLVPRTMPAACRVGHPGPGPRPTIGIAQRTKWQARSTSGQGRSSCTTAHGRAPVAPRSKAEYWAFASVLSTAMINDAGYAQAGDASV